MDVWDAIAAERIRFADLLDGLDDAQWRTQTLCGAWDVQHLAAHLLALSVTPMPAFVGTLARQRFSFARTAVHLAHRLAQQPRTQIVAELRRIAHTRVAPPVLGPMGPLTDLLVHRLDVLIPLGLPDDVAPGQWADGPLDLLVSPRARMGFVAGRLPALRYRATDTAWESGSGPEVAGPAAALALAIGRRTPRLGELDGAGAAALRTWAAG